MNYKMIYFVLGKMLRLLSFFLVLPLLTGLFFKENKNIIFTYVILIFICFIVSTTIIYFLKNNLDKKFYTKEGFVIVAATWIIYSILGSLPFYITGYIPNFIDALFETVSGLTTTGSSILNNIEALPKSLLIWRSFTHFIGGMGVIVFALAVLPRSPHNIHIMKAEVPGPIFGKVVSSMKRTAILLYGLYIGLSVVMFILLLFSGIGIFESLNITFSTAGTGGFATKTSGISFYNSNYVTLVVTIFMIIFAMNLNLVYIILAKRSLKYLNNEEFKWFISLIIISTIVIFINLYYSVSAPTENLLDVLFTVSSIISTTGFTYLNFSNWTMFSQIVILFLMICGGCAGGTAGGLKIPRIIYMLKNTRNYIRKSITPNKVIKLKIDNKTIEDPSIFSNYMLLYLIVFSIFSIILSIQIQDFEEVFTAVLSTLNNVGPGFNKFGPMENFSNVPYFSKFILTISMLLGRLEIIPFIVLFSRYTWRKKLNNK